MTNFPWIPDPISLIIGAILSFFIAIWLDFFIKLPKLAVHGWGSGRHQDGTIQNTLSVSNQVGWLGLTIQQTVLFGFRIHTAFRRGIPFETNPARDCRAQLHISESGEHICQLWWRLEDNSVTDVVSIDSGKTASLILFVRRDDNSQNYFPYQPLHRETGEVKFPEPPAIFNGNKKFEIKIHHSHNQIYSYHIEIEQKFNGLLYLKTATGSALF